MFCTLSVCVKYIFLNVDLLVSRSVLCVQSESTSHRIIIIQVNFAVSSLLVQISVAGLTVQDGLMEYTGMRKKRIRFGWMLFCLWQDMFRCGIRHGISETTF
jgi:hypothetical protein